MPNSKTLIKTINSRQIFDSRGNPTIEVEVTLSDGSFGRAAVPSGASTGEHEAVELRDGIKGQYLGKGVTRAIEIVNSTLTPALTGRDALDQSGIDNFMIEMDGTPNKSRLGANSILGVSLAIAHASAASQQMPLYQYLAGSENANLMPIPMLNILNGGSHADNNVDIQEFMVFPAGMNTFSEALRTGVEIFHQLSRVLKGRGLNTSVGDEGGFAPNLKSNEEALEIILEAVNNAGYDAGTDVYLTLDVAASEIYSDGKYRLDSENRLLSSEELIDYYKYLVDKYPIVSIEDGLSEDDWTGWQRLNQELGQRIQIVGDDLTVTNLKRLDRAIQEKSMNAILIKLNQVGTVSETIAAIHRAREAHFGTIISHRSGETEDTTIADFSVAFTTGQIKTGSASRTDRICKYNQLLRIEESLGSSAQFPGLEVLGKL
ncbi:MAG: phosphopyruvate hydratase [Candidatus Neomarinimicrobiota bacterium]